MYNEHLQVWDECLVIIKKMVRESAYKTWFEKITPKSLDGSTLVLQVPSKEHAMYIDEHFIDALQVSLHTTLGPRAELEYFIVNPRKLHKPLPYEVKPTRKDIRTNSVNPFAIPGIKKQSIDSQLNESYRFDNFIEGDCNRLARSAGIAVAKKPGKTSFNPLFIFGDVGLGKTHLAQAIGNQVAEHSEDKTVLYVSSEKFTNQFIESLQNNAVSDFVNFYQMIDTLIIDDIQFLENKEKTQDIFFTIFNHLHQSGKQLILTSDRPPRDLKGIEERLISRFKWGLSADLQLPSLETRMAIIQSKLSSEEVELPPSVIEFISHNVRTNVREIEGVLISIVAEAALNNRDINLDLAKEVIGKFIDNISNELTVEYIQRTVADYFGIEPSKLKEKTRKRLIVRARQLSMYLAKQLSNKSLKHIGNAFGGRDHSTVVHACKTIEDLLEKDNTFKSEFSTIQKQLKSTTVD